MEVLTIQRIFFVLCFQVQFLTKNLEIKSQLEEFRRAQKREETLKEKITTLVSKIKQDSQSNFMVRILGEILLTGSLNQGTFIASLFKENLKYKGSLINRDIDIDCKAIAIDLRLNQNCLKDINGKPGYVELLTNCIPEEEVWYRYFEKETKYLQPVLFKNKVSNSFNGPSSNAKERVSIVFLHYHFLKRGIIFKSINVKVSGKTSKATVKHIFEIQKDEKLYMNFEIDYAFMFKIFFRPNIMSNFLKRTRYNLSEEIIQYIYVLAKTSREQKHNINTTEWTYSFSHIENFILNSFSDTQKLVYVIFKSIFNKSLKHLDEDKLTSYIVKTIILWRFEDIELDDSDDWLNDTRIWETADILFKDLIVSFDRGFLKHYFIPEVNVLQRLDTDLRDSCRRRIKEIGKDLKKVLLTNEVAEARNFLEEVMHLLHDREHILQLEKLKSSMLKH
ncbi:uncharacterized protein [Clytia hemisphaerica]|uniref:Uncharacterized protein n=1 Tax=Clytia hemisphaerica TaxID=252671 RepID=A0A7M5UR70_9CNID